MFFITLFSEGKRPWCWERLRAGEGDDRGWDGWMASPTQWTWVWVDSESWWWTGRPGMLRSMGSQRVGHDWETEPNTVPGVFSEVHQVSWTRECGSQTSHWDCKDKIDLCPQRLCSDNALLSWSRSVGSHRSVSSPQLSTLGTLRQVLWDWGLLWGANLAGELPRP